MSLLIDYREGSEALVAPLLEAKLPAIESDLNSGDLAFVGRGVGGEGVMIGIEHKTIADALSSLRSNRLNEQAEKMEKDFAVRYIIVEGEIIINERGQLMRRAGWKTQKPYPGIRATEFFKRLFVLHLQRGLTPIFSPNRRTTIKIIEYLYRIWTDQDFDEHKSHLGLYQPPTHALASEFVDVISRLPGCGMKVASAAEKKFGTIRAAVNATEGDWAELTTKDKSGHARRFGGSNAQKVVTAVTNRRGKHARR